MSAVRRYSGISTINHWISALLVVAMLVLGFLAAGASEDATRSYIMGVHVGLGFFVFLFVVWRTVYRLYEGFPDALEGSPLEQRAAYLMHRVLLFLVALMVFTGPLYLFTEGHGMDVFGWFTVYIPLESLGAIHELMEVIHVYTGLYLLPVLLVLHVAAAIRHYLAGRQETPADLESSVPR